MLEKLSVTLQRAYIKANEAHQCLIQICSVLIPKRKPSPRMKAVVLGFSPKNNVPLIPQMPSFSTPPSPQKNPTTLRTFSELS